MSGVVGVTDRSFISRCLHAADMLSGICQEELWRGIADGEMRYGDATEGRH